MNWGESGVGNDQMLEENQRMKKAISNVLQWRREHSLQATLRSPGFEKRTNEVWEDLENALVRTPRGTEEVNRATELAAETTI